MELLIVLTISAILLGVAVPSFQSVLQDSRLRTMLDGPRIALFTARSESVKSGVFVTVCPRSSNTACGTDWNNGLLVFVDQNPVPNEVLAVRDSTDIILRVQEAHRKEGQLSVIASNDRTAAGEFLPNYIRFSSTGQADWASGSIIACDSRGHISAQALNVVLTGYIQPARAANDGDTVLDVFNRPVNCP